MRYGFVIDQDRCIGCHACTVACKEEHQVPLGVFRTWVKYVEKGAFPDTSRHFGVMRCNHCDSAPCTTICPTNALFRRSDGIIDFDNQMCIGCKGCMQACPYDALYIDPNTNTAAKCNFCAHRVEANQEPACVIVCPTQAIMAGDLDDSASQVSRVVATQKVAVRKPEKGTQPKLYYVGIEGDLLDPTRLSRQNTHMFAERRDGHVSPGGFDPQATREVYDVSHPSPWGWKISAYLWTKSISAGALIAVALPWGQPDSSIRLLYAPVVALIMLAVTLALLVLDLKRPDRFLYMLLKPNFRSWLVLGSFVLMAYGAAALAWLLCGIFLHAVPFLLVISTVLLAVASACYSAFLFAQCRGRELWQSRMFIVHLLMQALIGGAAAMSLVALTVPWGYSPEWGMRISGVTVLLLMLHLLMVVVEFFRPHASAEMKLATESVVRGKLRFTFWFRVVFLGTISPVLMIAAVAVSALMHMESPAAYAAVIIDVLALYGLWWFEDIWIKAGQSVPLS
ncbi:MAG TPA: 4Fe-4S dicluster domain-containing protein [Candidatus Saccharimonadales bacterium]|jgi:Fe-S-cluster-containing dehydrogenase component/formate-dependent nitrite reductase membrane component NrfD|nr:4Fe-4S dicluster domain-containing protein [Candidatus Saccharimonadales bacterium]